MTYSLGSALPTCSNCPHSPHPGECAFFNCPCAMRTDISVRKIVTTTTGNEIDPDGIDHPAHYNRHPSGVECIEVVRHMGFNLGNVVKYLWRDGLKDTSVDLQDLKKALWYLQDEIALREGSVDA